MNSTVNIASTSKSFTHALINISNTYYIPGIERGTGEIKMAKAGQKVYLNQIVKLIVNDLTTICMSYVSHSGNL